MIGFWGGFHGKTGGVLGLLGDDFKHDLGPLLPGLYSSPYADCYRCPFEARHPECDLPVRSTSCARRSSYETTGDIAAIIVEPIQGTAGNVVPPPGFLARDAGDRRRERRAPHRRRDDHRLRPHRPDVRLRARRRRARHHDRSARASAAASRSRASSRATRSSSPSRSSNPSGSSSSYGGNPLAAAAALVDGAARSSTDDLVENSARVGRAHARPPARAQPRASPSSATCAARPAHRRRAGEGPGHPGAARQGDLQACSSSECLQARPDRDGLQPRRAHQPARSSSTRRRPRRGSRSWSRAWAMSQQRWLVKHPEVEEAFDLLFYRPVGYGVSLLLRPLPVTPDHVSLAAAAVGLLGGHLLFYGRPAADLAGAIRARSSRPSSTASTASSRACAGPTRPRDACTTASPTASSSSASTCTSGHGSYGRGGTPPCCSSPSRRSSASSRERDGRPLPQLVPAPRVCSIAEPRATAFGRCGRGATRRGASGAGPITRLLLFFYVRIAAQQEALQPGPGAGTLPGSTRRAKGASASPSGTASSAAARRSCFWLWHERAPDAVARVSWRSAPLAGSSGSG